MSGRAFPDEIRLHDDLGHGEGYFITAPKYRVASSTGVPRAQARTAIYGGASPYLWRCIPGTEVLSSGMRHRHHLSPSRAYMGQNVHSSTLRRGLRDAGSRNTASVGERAQP